MKLRTSFVSVVLPTLVAAAFAVGCTRGHNVHARNMPDRPAAPVQLSMAPPAPADAPAVVAIR